MAEFTGGEMTSLRQVHRALGMLGRRHALVMELFRLATEWHDEGELLEAALGLLERRLEVEATSVIMLDRQVGDLYFAAATGPVNEAVTHIRFDAGEGLAGWCMETGQVVRVTEVAEEPRWHREVSEQLGFDVRQLLAAPIKVRSRTIGCLELVNKRRGTFEPEDEELAREVAECIGILFTMRGRVPSE